MTMVGGIIRVLAMATIVSTFLEVVAKPTCRVAPIPMVMVGPIPSMNSQTIPTNGKIPMAMVMVITTSGKTALQIRHSMVMD